SWLAPGVSSHSNFPTTGRNRRGSQPPPHRRVRPQSLRKFPTPEGVPMSDPATLVVFRGAPAGLRRGSLQTFARRLRDRVAPGREFLCLITGDGELQRLNRQFLGKDYPTDVLSFPAATDP